MRQRGYDLIIGHGIELSEPILTVAKDFPKIHFAASGGPDLAGKLTANTDGWTYDFAQQGYLSGWVAGKTGVAKVGAVGGPQLPFILASHKGFKAGLAETDPSATVLEVFTGSFDDVQKAVEATKGLIGQGAQLVWTSGDGIGNGVAAAAEQAEDPYPRRHRQRRRIGEEGEYRQCRTRHVSDVQGLRGRGQRRQLR